METTARALDDPPAHSSDPAVSRALHLIHSRFAEKLDTATLAREAGVSRSVLGERFARLIGEPPMHYCGRWRLRQAAIMLRDGDRKAGEVAYAVGFGSEEAFSRAFRRAYGQAPATWRRQARSSRSPEALPRQQVHHCTARDGTRLAWSSVGAGFPLVKTANWLNHLEFDWESPVWRHWLRELMRDNRLIRYDERGNGLSDWDPTELSFDSFVDDLESVVEAAGLAEFDLLGISQGAPVAIAYSLRHPGRIRRMVLLGGYARGWALRLKGEDLARREAMVTLTQTGWGSDVPAYRQMFTGLYIPGGTPEQLDWWNELQKVSATPANAVRLQRVLGTIDVTGLLARVTVPTLVAHARNDHVIAFEAGRELADGIPGATFVELDSANHVLLEHEPAWPHFLTAMRRFLRR
ncbi:alpha/beta fold hydrolase [Sphingosinicella sp. YJ22]|uniref:alpha/beta fold hydrolase n=1 Tax=Sphingosinicella sp. YJ22 TaxID=1104780 RepID=UPI00140B24EB|nr:alpha/beta fold hydrolase [Sphingosinicella sp. YJ22]